MDTDSNIEPFCCTKPAISKHFKGILPLKDADSLTLFSNVMVIKAK